jgi:hypothetical protein
MHYKVMGVTCRVTVFRVCVHIHVNTGTQIIFITVYIYSMNRTHSARFYI